MALAPSYIVNVQERISTDVSAVQDFSKTLFLHTPATSTNASVLRLHGSVPTYGSLQEVEREWTSGSAPHTAASVYFSQTPYPGGFAVASYFAAARAGTVAGATIATSQADVRAFGATASFTFLGVTCTANMASITTPATVATALQTGINAQSNITGVTVAATGTDITQPQSYTVSVPAALASVTQLDVSQGFDGALPALLGLTEVTEAVYARPFAQDSNTGVALSRAEGIDDTFYFVTMAPALESTAANITSASQWAESRIKMLGFETSDANALSTGDVTSPIALTSTAQRKRTFGVFTRNPDGKALSIAARFSSVDYNGIGTNINLAHKTLPGTTPDDDLTQAQVDLLASRGASVYARVANSPRVLFGGTADGGFVDARVWADWLTSRLQTALLDLLGSSNLIPLSQRGSNQLLASVIEVCSQGQANGGFTPGDLDAALVGSVRSVTGNNGFTGALSNGFFAYVAPQSLADSDNRIAPPIYVWGIYRGGVNRINIDLALGD